MSWVGAVLAIGRSADCEQKSAYVQRVLVRAADRAATVRPTWWRWSVYLAVALTIERTKRILATGKDPWLLTAQI